MAGIRARSILIVVTLFLFLSFIPLQPCYAVGWSSVAKPGFGNPMNFAIYNLIEFRSYLYAGTRNGDGCEVWRSPNGTGWTIANKRGFDDPTNSAAWSMVVFNRNLYVGTYKANTGAELWRTSNGTSWSQVNTDGFGKNSNVGIYSLCVFQNRLYASTYNQGGAELWRSSNGSTWARCTSTFPWSASNKGIYSMAASDSALYVGTSNETNGCEVWKSTNGSSFSKVGQNGFGDPNNKTIYCLSFFAGNLFAGTKNIANGCEVWKNTGGKNWAQSNVNGFGDSANSAVWSFGQFAKGFFAGTWNEGTGTEVWSTPDGTSWKQVNADGFGNKNNQVTLAMCKLRNYFYFGTYNYNAVNRSSEGAGLYRYGPEEDLDLPNVWYFAEGTTREGFQTYLCIENPQQVNADIDITYMMSSSEYLLQKETVPAMSRKTVDVNAFVAGEKDFATKVSSNQPILVERPIYFKYQGKWSGGSDVVGSPTANTAWYFAEGTTRENFDEYICVENPGAAQAEVLITYMLGTGEKREQDVPVPSNSRVTVNVRDAVGPDQDVSAFLASTNPVIAERPMYFNYKGKWDGGHTVMGAVAPDTSWYFAEGTTRDGFETWLCLQNPGEKEAKVAAKFMRGDGKTDEKSITIPPKTRITYSLNEALGPNLDVSTLLTSNKPIIAERPMYFNYHGKITGGHTAVGVNAPKKTWYLAEGTTRDNKHDGTYNEWLCIQNPGDSSVEVTINYVLGSGEPRTQVVAIPKHSRYTVDVNSTIGPDQDVSATLTAPSPIIVERPMYFNTNRGANDGHVVMGFAVR